MVKIEPLPASKWEEYRKLRLDALRKDPIAFGSSYEEEILLKDGDWRRRIKNSIFATNKGVPIGMIVYISNKKLKFRHIANLYGFYVKKEYRRRGIGKKLLKSAISAIRKKKKTIKIVLNVDTNQRAAIRAYKGVGFKLVGKLKKESYFNGKYYDEIIMEKFVR